MSRHQRDHEIGDGYSEGIFGVKQTPLIVTFFRGFMWCNLLLLITGAGMIIEVRDTKGSAKNIEKKLDQATDDMSVGMHAITNYLHNLDERVRKLEKEPSRTYIYPAPKRSLDRGPPPGG